MQLLPRSLFSRLVLVLMTGLVLAQILSLALHAHERGRLLSEASGMQAAQRIADIVKVLDPLTAEERRRVVSILSAPPLTIALGEGPALAAREDSASRARAAFFEAMLTRLLGERRPISVVVMDAASWKGVRRMRALEEHPMHGASMDFRQGPPYFGHGGLSFVARIPLRDGTMLTFDSRQPAETLTWPYRLLGSLAILLAAVIALSLIAVRWTTRPLHTLADAAERLGANIHRPPLAETGPLEVQRAARAFNTMQTRLIASLRERTQMLAAMSHDLKTPITRLKLRAEMLDDEKLRGKFVADLEEMESMVARTLEFMRGLRTGEPRLPIDINALVQTVQSDVRETGREVELAGAARAPYFGQPQALKRCISNLVENAVQYGAEAAIEVDDDDERLEVRVCDRGPGIPEAALERVFEPFYRVEGSRSRETGGTGLGLSIARAIAEGHGGTLSLRNRAEGGLEAILTLPRERQGPFSRR